MNPLKHAVRTTTAVRLGINRPKNATGAKTKKSRPSDTLTSVSASHALMSLGNSAGAIVRSLGSKMKYAMSAFAPVKTVAASQWFGSVDGVKGCLPVNLLCQAKTKAHNTKPVVNNTAAKYQTGHWRFSHRCSRGRHARQLNAVAIQAFLTTSGCARSRISGWRAFSTFAPGDFWTN